LEGPTHAPKRKTNPHQDRLGGYTSLYLDQHWLASLGAEGLSEDYESIPVDRHKGRVGGQMLDSEVVIPWWIGGHGLEAAGHGTVVAVALAATN
jgi:hypothetical protein